MRPALLIALLPAATLLSSGVWAKTPELDRLRLLDQQRQNMAEQARQNEISRQAADLNQVTADLARAQTEARLQALGQPPPGVAAPIPAPVPAPWRSPEPISANAGLDVRPAAP